MRVLVDVYDDGRTEEFVPSSWAVERSLVDLLRAFDPDEVEGRVTARLSVEDNDYTVSRAYLAVLEEMVGDLVDRP